MCDKIKVMFLKPTFAPQIIEMENNLTAFQEMVMGYIEAMPLGDKFVAIVNEEGKLLSLDENFMTEYDVIVGNAVICRTGGEEFASLEDGDEEEILDLIESC